MSRLPSAVVSPSWLRDALAGPSPPVVVDSTWHMPGSPFACPEGELPAREQFNTRRIPGAKFIDIDAIGDAAIAPTTPHNLPLPGRFAAEMARLGVSKDTPVVCYDTLGVFSSPRVWWTFRAYNHAEVAVLDGGLPGWLLAGGAVASTPPEASAAAAAEEPWALQPGAQWSRADVAGNVASAACQLADARSAGRFAGTAPEPRPSLRGGHVPGSLSLPFTELVAKGGDGVWRVKGDEQLRAAFAAAGVDLEKPLAATCGSGLTAAFIALAAARLGAPLTSLYDGSWTEWGDPQFAMPVETGAPVARQKL